MKLSANMRLQFTLGKKPITNESQDVCTCISDPNSKPEGIAVDDLDLANTVVVFSAAVLLRNASTLRRWQ